MWDYDGMTIDEQIIKEQENNDRLEREIADLKAKAQRTLRSAESKPIRERGSAVQRWERDFGGFRGEPLRVRLRQKKESDERLKALRNSNQSELAGDNPRSQANKAGAHIPQIAAKKRRRGPTAWQKLANPSMHPTMTVQEVVEVVGGVSRTTVYRWAEEGPLKRASLGKETGRRRRVLILTESVVEMLKESSE